MFLSFFLVELVCSFVSCHFSGKSFTVSLVIGTRTELDPTQIKKHHLENLTSSFFFQKQKVWRQVTAGSNMLPNHRKKKK